MSKNASHLKRLAAYAHLMLDGGAVDQVAALCLRTDASGRPEVLLITTRETGRWTIPKGWPIKGLKPHEAAEREAWEEGGVKGKANKKVFGRFTYLKTLDDGNKVPAIVDVYLLEVASCRDKFPESAQRLIEWLTPVDAALRVAEPELKSLLLSLFMKAKAS